MWPNKRPVNKRPAFLPAEVRKEFGCFVKKPRLDVRLTPLSPHSPNKTTLSSSGKDSIDELWGEAIPDEAIEECELLATQAYEQVNILKTASVNTEPAEKAKQQKNLASCASENVSNGLPGSSYFVSNNLSNPSSSVQKHTKLSESLLPDIVIQQQESSKQEKENKELKEKCMQKDGEIAILRSQLKQLQVQLGTLKLDHMKSLECQALKFAKQMNEQKKELDVTNTQLQFQIMEATSMRNHCKVLESASKIKLIEPKAISLESPKMKKESREEEQKRRSSSFGFISPMKRRTFPDRNYEVIPSNEMKPLRPPIREGAVLGCLVNEYLTVEPQPDISWILYLRKKQSLFRKIKEADGLNSKILNLQKCSQTLERCYSAINKLITLDAVSSSAAYFSVESIVKECQKIVCRQMHILVLLCSVQSYAERGSLNGIVASVIGTSATSTNHDLMSASRWYDEEEGVESRRALGLLCMLCQVSGLASELTSGAKSLTNHSEEIASKIIHPNRDKHEIPLSSQNLIVQKEPEVCENEGLTSPLQRKDRTSYTEYLNKPFGFLKLLKDIAFSISFQRRTRQYVGLLYGIVKLLISIAKTTTFVSESLDVVSEILRDVVFCRPQIEVVVPVFELLANIGSYPQVMRSLCINSSIKSFVDIKHIGLTYFTRESCVTQVLFRLLPNCTTSLSLRTDLCFFMVKWLRTAVCFCANEPCWLLTLQDNKKVSCNCRDTLASGLLTTLYNSLCDLDAVSCDAENVIKWKLIETLKSSILLMRIWQQHDEEYWKYLAKDIFEYQVLLAKIHTDSIKMHLSDLEKECVTEFLGKPEERSDVVVEGSEEEEEYWNIISTDSQVLLRQER